MYQSCWWEMLEKEPRVSVQRCSAKGLGQPPSVTSVPRGLGARASALPFQWTEGKK